MVHRARLAHIVVREGSFLTLSIAGAILFLNHQILYMQGEKPSSLSWIAYAASTAVIYAFVRGMFFVGAMRVPRASQDPSVCPECGQPLPDGTPLAPLPARIHAPDSGSPQRPSRAAVRLARPIVSSTPPISPSEDPVNPSLDMLLQKLIDNPPAPRFEPPGPSPQGSIAGPSADGERR